MYKNGSKNKFEVKNIFQKLFQILNKNLFLVSNQRKDWNVFDDPFDDI